ncbi:MAG: MoaD/ThiS family protein [Pelovirga sp.]
MPTGTTISVTVKLYGVFRIGRYKEQRLTLPQGLTAQAVFDQLQLNPQLIGIVLINDRHRDLSAMLADGDVLAFLPLLEGG